jgi:hypothetical protein
MSDPAQSLICPNGHLSSDRGYCTVCGTTMVPSVPADSSPTTLVPPGSFGSRGPFAALAASTCPHCSAQLDEGSRFCEVCGYDPETGSLPEAPAVRPAAAEPAPADSPAPGSPGSSDGTLAPSGSFGGLSTDSGPASGPVSRPVPGPAPNRWSAAPVAPGAGAGAATALVAVITADRPYYESHYVSEVDFPVGVPARTIELPAAPVHIGRRSRSRGTDPAIDLAGPPEDSAVSHTHASLLPTPDGGWELVDHGSTNGTYLNESPEPLSANQPRRVGPGDRIYVGAWTRITLEASPYR